MKILDFPDTRQATGFSCGAAVAQAVLYYYGIERREDKLIDLLDTDQEGTDIEDLMRLLRSKGLHFKSGKMTLEEVKSWIDQRVPVILLIQAWADDPEKDYSTAWDDGHYVVAIGYDDEGQIYFSDPSVLDQTAFLHEDELEARWHDEDEHRKLDHFGIAVWGRKPWFDSDRKVHILAKRIAARFLTRKGTKSGST